MSRVALASSGRRTFLRKLTDSSWRTCVLTTPVRSRHSSSTRALARSCFAPAALSCAYIRMLVSTKYLSLMEFISRPGRSPLQVQPFTKSGQGAASSLVEGLTFTNDCLEAIGQKRTDGATFFGGNDARLPKKVSVEFERDVCLHGFRD